MKELFKLSEESKQLQSFITDLNLIVKDVGSNFTIRYNKESTSKFNKTKFNFTNTLYASAKILNNKSIDYVVNELKIDNITSASKNALVKIRNEDKTHNFIKKVSDKLLKKVYDENNNFIKRPQFKLNGNGTCYIETDKPDTTLFINNTDKRIIANDGMQYNFCEEAINNETILRSLNGNYGIMEISGLFDVINKIPINYHPIALEDKNKKSVNEVKGFLQQSDKLNCNDIVIFDRFYYSKDFHKKLISKDIGYIFRATKTCIHFDDVVFNEPTAKIINGANVQLFKYIIESEQYNIITSITENISIGEIKALYWRRWQIEIDNRKFKYNVLASNIRSKNNNSIATDIECVKFVSILSSIIEHLGKHKCKENQKINTSNCIEILYNRLLYLLLYDSDNIEQICNVVGIIYKTLVYMVEGRQCRRVKVSPPSKWTKDGNRNNKNRK